MGFRSNGSGGDVKSPTFTLRSLKEIKVGLLPEYWEKYLGIENRSILRRLKEGVRVKVLAQSVGHQKNPCEELWLKICHRDRKARKYIGEIVIVPERSKFHGLLHGMLIHFEEKHILDVWMDDLT
jgi:hypothetical protein